MATSISFNSSTTQSLAAIVFGIIATLLRGVTVYQVHRTWQLWRRHQQYGLESQGLYGTTVRGSLYL